MNAAEAKKKTKEWLDYEISERERIDAIMKRDAIDKQPENNAKFKRKVKEWYDTWQYSITQAVSKAQSYVKFETGINLKSEPNWEIVQAAIKKLEKEGFIIHQGFDTVFTGADEWEENHYVEVRW